MSTKAVATPAASASSSNTVESSSTLLSGRLKRSRILLPRDRMAYFSVISLLADKNAYEVAAPREDNPITPANCEEVVPAQKHQLLKKLKQVLMYDV